jgi:hypothetical protein
MKKMGCAQCGGAMKKMQKGGSTGIVGMPKYSNNPRSEQGRILKKGGSTTAVTNRAVRPGCFGGKVKDENGRCVMERKMAKGGSTSFGMLSVKAGIDKNPKATAADRIAGARKNKKVKKKK